MKYWRKPYDACYMNAIQYLKKEVRKSIINDILDIAKYHSRPDKKKEAGFYSVPRQVFCYVDYLGHLAYGNGYTTEHAERFIREYFPKNYRGYAELLYSMWRHGTVHTYKPKRIFAKYPGDKPEMINIYSLSNNANEAGNRQANMKFFPMHGKKATLYLCINICQLVDDLLSALDGFIQKLKSEERLERECSRRIADLDKPQEYKTNQRSASRQAAYEQIRKAWQMRSEEIDRRGCTFKK